MLKANSPKQSGQTAMLSRKKEGKKKVQEDSLFIRAGRGKADVEGTVCGGAAKEELGPSKATERF